MKRDKEWISHKIWNRAWRLKNANVTSVISSKSRICIHITSNFKCRLSSFFQDPTLCVLLVICPIHFCPTAAAYKTVIHSRHAFLQDTNYSMCSVGNAPSSVLLSIRNYFLRKSSGKWTLQHGPEIDINKDSDRAKYGRIWNLGPPSLSLPSHRLLPHSFNPCHCFCQ